MKVHAQFLTAATEVRQFPAAGAPEIAFVGRSNVGKSSLINCLLGAKVARTSSTPGRTRTINFFTVRWPGRPRPEVIFADLPGYGYARVAREIAAEWPSFIEPYLKERGPLALCIALVDASVPPQENDRLLIRFLRAAGRPFLIAATKSDRLSANSLQNSLRLLAEEFAGALVLPFSARSSVGRDELWRRIRSAAEAGDKLRA